MNIIRLSNTFHNFRKFFRVLSSILFVLLHFTSNVDAALYPERSNTEMISLRDPRVDFSFRNWLVTRAKSIRLISSTQTDTDEDLALLFRIRDAQERGVPVQFLYDFVSSFTEGDKLNSSSVIISDPTVLCPGEVYCGNPVDRVRAGIGWNEFMHQKIFIVNEGLHDEVIIISGRNNSVLGVNSLDSAFILRPIDPNLPYAGTDIKDHFNKLIQLMRSISRPQVVKPTLLNQKWLKRLRSRQKDPDILLSAEQNVQLQELKDLLSTPATRDGPRLPYQFQPTTLQYASSDLFAQQKAARDIGIKIAKENLENDIIDSTIRHFDEAPSGTVIKVTGYSIAPVKKLHDAMIRFIQRGGILQVYTNGAEAHATLGVGLGTLPFYYSVEELRKIISATNGSKGRLEIYLLDAKLATKNSLPPFIHRKAYIYHYPAGSGKVDRVGTGSANPTVSSAYKNDECFLSVKDHDAAKYMTELLDSEMPAFVKTSYEQLEAFWKKVPLTYFCLRSTIRASY